MARVKFNASQNAHEYTKKKTTIGNTHSRIKSSSMNKDKKRSYKRYKGQGK